MPLAAVLFNTTGLVNPVAQSAVQRAIYKPEEETFLVRGLVEERR